MFVTRPPALEVGNGSDSDNAAVKSETQVTTKPAKPHAKVVDKDVLDKETQLTIDTEKATPIDGDLPSPLDGMTGVVGGVPISYTRPDVADLVRSSIEATAADKRVLVMGCGPEGLMKCVRDTTASCIRSDGPSVELHCEQFGW